MRNTSPSKRTIPQWKRHYSLFMKFCRKSPWKIDDVNLPSFKEFKEWDLENEKRKQSFITSGLRRFV